MQLLTILVLFIKSARPKFNHFIRNIYYLTFASNFSYLLFAEKIHSKYRQAKGEVFLVDLLKSNDGLGISLSGHRDRTQMSVFVCGLNPSGNAFKDGRIHVGDEVLEVR